MGGGAPQLRTKCIGHKMSALRARRAHIAELILDFSLALDALVVRQRVDLVHKHLEHDAWVDAVRGDDRRREA